MAALAACTSEPPEVEGLPASDMITVPVEEVEVGGVVRLGAETFPATFNPVHVEGVSSSTLRVLESTQGSAVRVAADGAWQVDGNYAQSVEVVDTDPLTVEVRLEPDAVWEDGSPVRSADMVAYVDAMQDSDFLAAPHPAMNDVEEIDVKSDFHYRVVFARPNADWPAVIYPPLPADITTSADRFNESLTTVAPPSLGPFRVAEIAEDTGTVRLEPNPQWWGAKPALDEIVWRFATPTVLSEAFLAGDLDILPVTPDTKIDLVEADTFVAATAAWSQLTLNGGRGPLKDAAVRQAVALAIDRQEIAELSTAHVGVAGTPLDTVVLLPGQQGHQALGARPDRERARELLSESGWVLENGVAMREGESLELVMPVPAGRHEQVERAHALADQLADIGIRVRLDEVADDTFFSDRVISLDFDLVTFSRWGSAFNTSVARRWFTPIDGSENFTGVASKALRTAFGRAVSELDAEARAEAILEVEEIAARQASIIPLAVFPQVWAYADSVVNLGPTQFEDVDWTRVGRKAGR